MKYLLMIYGNEGADAAQTPAAQQTEMAAYFAFTDELKKAGAMIDGKPLHPSSTATTVRVRDGKVQTVDGPFAETKEQCGGYYLVECKNLDEAIEWAAKIPHAKKSGIEVRPILEFSQTKTA